MARPDCVNTSPGVTNIYLTQSLWIDNFPARQDYAGNPGTAAPLTLDSSVTGITLDTATYTEAGWSHVKTMPDKSSFVETLQGDKGAQSYQQVLNFQLAGHQNLLDQFVEFLGGVPVIAVFTYRDGSMKVLGEPNNPAYLLEQESNSGTASGDFIGHTLSLQVETAPLMAPYYDGTITPLLT